MPHLIYLPGLREPKAAPPQEPVVPVTCVHAPQWVGSQRSAVHRDSGHLFLPKAMSAARTQVQARENRTVPRSHWNQLGTFPSASC